MPPTNAFPRFVCDYHIPPFDILRSHISSTIMVILHGMNKRNEGYFGLSFPDYSEKNLGDVIRLVSYSKDCLINFKNHPIIKLLVKNQSVESLPIKPLSDTEKEVRFIRDRRNDRRRVGHWTNLGLSEPEAIAKIDELDEISDTLHYIWMRSNNGNLFKIYIRCEQSRKRFDGKFSSYGLSYSTDGATVPG